MLRLLWCRELMDCLYPVVWLHMHDQLGQHGHSKDRRGPAEAVPLSCLSQQAKGPGTYPIDAASSHPVPRAAAILPSVTHVTTGSSRGRVVAKVSALSSLDQGVRDAS